MKNKLVIKINSSIFENFYYTEIQIKLNENQITTIFTFHQ